MSGFVVAAPMSVNVKVAIWSFVSPLPADSCHDQHLWRCLNKWPPCQATLSTLWKLVLRIHRNHHGFDQIGGLHSTAE